MKKLLLLSIVAICLSLAISSYAYSYIYTCGKISGNSQLLQRLYNNPSVLNPFIKPAVISGNSQLLQRLYNNPSVLNFSCANKK